MAVFGPPGGVGDSGLPELWSTDGETGEAARGEDYLRDVSHFSCGGVKIFNGAFHKKCC